MLKVDFILCFYNPFPNNNKKRVEGKFGDEYVYGINFGDSFTMYIYLQTHQAVYTLNK